jgi:hypothetical protein
MSDMLFIQINSRWDTGLGQWVNSPFTRVQKSQIQRITGCDCPGKFCPFVVRGETPIDCGRYHFELCTSSGTFLYICSIANTFWAEMDPNLVQDQGTKRAREADEERKDIERYAHLFEDINRLSTRYEDLMVIQSKATEMLARRLGVIENHVSESETRILASLLKLSDEVKKTSSVQTVPEDEAEDQRDAEDDLEKELHEHSKRAKNDLVDVIEIVPPSPEKSVQDITKELKELVLNNEGMIKRHSCIKQKFGETKQILTAARLNKCLLPDARKTFGAFFWMVTGKLWDPRVQPVSEKEIVDL